MISTRKGALKKIVYISLFSPFYDYLNVQWSPIFTSVKSLLYWTLFPIIENLNSAPLITELDCIILFLILDSLILDPEAILTFGPIVESSIITSSAI